MTTLSDSTDSRKAMGRIAHTQDHDPRQAAAARPVIISTAAGFVVKPNTLLLRSICNGVGARDIDRSRYQITAGV